MHHVNDVLPTTRGHLTSRSLVGELLKSTQEKAHLGHVIGRQTNIREGPQSEDGDAKTYRKFRPRLIVLFPLVILIAHIVEPNDSINVVARSILTLNVLNQCVELHRPAVHVPFSKWKDRPVACMQPCHWGEIGCRVVLPRGKPHRLNILASRDQVQLSDEPCCPDHVESKGTAASPLSPPTALRSASPYRTDRAVDIQVEARRQCH